MPPCWPVGRLLTGYRAASWPLWVIPLDWCVVSGISYQTMGCVQGFAPLVLAITTLAATVMLHRRDRVGTRLREWA